MDELRDPGLDRALRARAAVGAVDTLAAHDRVLRRASTIRRRRAVASGIAAFVVIVAGSALWLRGGGDGIESVPATDATIGSTTVSASTVASPETTVATTFGPTSTQPPTTADPSVTGRTTATTTATTVPTAPAPTSATTQPGTTSPPPPATETKTFTSSGGSITVRSSGSGLTLVSVDPAAGYDQEIEDQRADRVRVRFRTATDSWRIEVRLENGQMVDTISN